MKTLTAFKLRGLLVAGLSFCSGLGPLCWAYDAPSVFRHGSIDHRTLLQGGGEKGPVMLAAGIDVEKNKNAPADRIIQNQNLFPLQTTEPIPGQVVWDIGCEVHVYTDHPELYPPNETIDLGYSFLYDPLLPKNSPQPRSFAVNVQTTVKAATTGSGFVVPASTFKKQRGQWALSVCYNAQGTYRCNSPIQFQLNIK
jgi:hypothetical protein